MRLLRRKRQNRQEEELFDGREQQSVQGGQSSRPDCDEALTELLGVRRPARAVYHAQKAVL